MLNILRPFFVLTMAIIGFDLKNIHAAHCTTIETPPDHHIDDAHITTEMPPQNWTGLTQS